MREILQKNENSILVAHWIFQRERAYIESFTEQNMLWGKNYCSTNGMSSLDSIKFYPILEKFYNLLKAIAASDA